MSSLISCGRFFQLLCCWETVFKLLVQLLFEKPNTFLVLYFNGNELQSAECFVEFFLFLLRNMCSSCVKAGSTLSPPQNTTNSSVK